MSYEPGYTAAVADGLVFALRGEVWARLSAHDGAINLATVKAELARLRKLGVRIDFGDGEVAAVPDTAGSVIATLEDQLRRIREVAPIALASGADTFARVMCTDPWPRIYTTAVLKWPSRTPVHVVQASDLAAVLEQWEKVPELAKFSELRTLRLFGSPLDGWPWPLELGVFRELQALDLATSRLRAVPRDIANATALEAIELADNPLDAGSLDVLAALPRLRYVGLRGTRIEAAQLAGLRAKLPEGCELALS